MRAAAACSWAIEQAKDRRTKRVACAGPKSRPGVSATWARCIRSRQKSQLSALYFEQSNQT